MIRVLVVDDSHFFRQRLKDLIEAHPDLRVVGLASNGLEAVEMAARLTPDVISMDYEMPFMDGITALKAILASRFVPVVMVSSLTFDGARITIEALAAGALDFIPKNFAQLTSQAPAIKRQIHNTLLSCAAAKKGAAVKPVVLPAMPLGATVDNAASAAVSSPAQRLNPHKPLAETALEADSPPPTASQRLEGLGDVRVIVIGASTGGPVAIHQVLSHLPARFPIPIVVVQHMPPPFTRALAERLDAVCALSVAEVVPGAELTPGSVWVAQGGMQLLFDQTTSSRLKSLRGDAGLHYKPSLDITLASAATVFHHRVLALVLTGMGQDGLEGARLVKQQGASVWTQDADSCVVFGMPKAVVDAGFSDWSASPAQLGQRLATRCRP
jgi:two-component system, chemotaxis family, protein-glutamate methylesterase/glutaminase